MSLSVRRLGPSDLTFPPLCLSPLETDVTFMTPPLSTFSINSRLLCHDRVLETLSTVVLVVSSQGLDLFPVSPFRFPCRPRVTEGL